MSYLFFILCKLYNWKSQFQVSVPNLKSKSQIQISGPNPPVESSKKHPPPAYCHIILIRLRHPNPAMPSKSDQSTNQSATTPSKSSWCTITESPTQSGTWWVSYLPNDFFFFFFPEFFRKIICGPMMRLDRWIMPQAIVMKLIMMT